MSRINRLTHSDMTGNYYFVISGEKIENDHILARKKVDVTDQVKKFIISALFRIEDGRCIFCESEVKYNQILTKRNLDNKLIDIKISLCEKCEVPS